MLATAIFAGAAGILDDQNNPVVVGYDVTPVPGGLEVAVDAYDTESGIASYAFYAWKGNDYVLASEQPGGTYVFSDIDFGRFKVVVTDWAGNYVVIEEIGAWVKPLLVNVYGEESAELWGDTEFTISIQEARNALYIELDFEFENNFLTFKELTTLAGFDIYKPISFTENGNITSGNVVLVFPSGGPAQGFTSIPPADVAKLVFGAKNLGDTAFKLLSVRVTAFDPVTSLVTYYHAFLGDDVAGLFIGSKYDLYKDNTVDALDLSVALLYFGYTDADTVAWTAFSKVKDTKDGPIYAYMCDFVADGVIDMLDLMEIYLNYFPR
jgi:hypothetical protein